MALVKVSTNKRYLTNPQDKPFFVLGVNYNGYFDRAWQMWEANLFDADLIARDFRKAQNSGFNTVRLAIDSTLSKEISQDKFAKLDQILSLAQKNQLMVLLTLNGTHSLNLEQVGELNVKIVSRYKNMPTLLGYDLENEPTFYNLAAANYPARFQPAIQTSQLVDHYGIRVERNEIAELKRRQHIPNNLDDETAFHYINALHLFREYDAATKAFEQEGRGTLFDYMISNEATDWHTLIGVLDSTIENWLQAHLDPIRATDSKHLLTVGWNWLHFALLPANRALDFQSYHNFTPLSLTGFNTNISHLQSLRRSFPDHPILLTEFGWSNSSAAHQPIDAELTALYEGAMMSFLRANSFGGGCKWMLNDAQDGTNSEESNFGIFKVGDEIKAIGELMGHFAQNWPAVERQAIFFAALRDLNNGLAYRFDFPEQITIGGHTYQDNAISWQAEGVAAHCFLKREPNQLTIEAHGAGRLSIDPYNVIPSWNLAHEADLYRVYNEDSRTQQHTFAPLESVVIDVRPGAKYVVTMGTKPPFALPDSVPQAEPRIGEHVILVADSNNYLPACLKYIRRFAPDLTFVPEEVAGRWGYVTVVASPQKISDETLDTIRGMGALIVERLIGENPRATQSILDDLANRGQRFLTPVAFASAQEEPPTESTIPTNGVGKNYLVQPGDTLSKIAQRVYGNFQLWRLIFEANQDKLAAPGVIRVGMALRLPERE